MYSFAHLFIKHEIKLINLKIYIIKNIHIQHTILVQLHSLFPEPLCWLLSLEGSGRYLCDLHMKHREGESIHPNTTIRDN